jgi:hypothetical protein
VTYRARPIRFLGHWEHQAWRLKLYGISAWGELPSAELVTSARSIAQATLPSPATADGRHGVGFVGAHEGANASFVFVSWWAKLYELNHFLFRAPRGQAELLPVERGLAGCTWDLRLISFERDAWIASMVGGTEGPNLDTYMAATFNSDT